MDLTKFQQEHREWVTKNFGIPCPERINQPILGAVEELGKLARAQLKYEQGIRGYDKHRYFKEFADSIGDIVIYLTDACSCNGLSFEEVLERTWEQVRKRDWTRNRVTG